MGRYKLIMDARTRGVCLLLMLLSAGCAKQNGSAVTGTVTYVGKPLTTGAVTFQPIVAGPIAVGDIQSDGSFTLQTGSEIGLQPGEYLATVVATGPIPEATPADPMPLPKLLVPARYGDVNTSGLKYTITPGPNTIQIQLTE